MPSRLAPLVTLSATIAQALGVQTGDAVVVAQGEGSVNLVAAVDPRLPANVVRVAAGHPLTAVLGDAFGPISVDKAAVAAAA